MRASSTQVHETEGLIKGQIVVAVGETVAWPIAELVALAERRRAAPGRTRACWTPEPLLQQKLLEKSF